MKTPLRLKVVSALPLFVMCLAVSDLHAQAPVKIFVASFGNDANDGSRGNPKRNFQAAHNAVANRGQIVVLDTANYGPLNISKSLAVTVPSGVSGFVSVTGTSNAITISAAADAIVSLRGLIIEGGGNRQSTGNGPGFGIYVLAVGRLTVEDCTIRNFLDALPFVPSNAGATLTVQNTRVRNCRYGIDVQAVAGSGGTKAVIARCDLENLAIAVSNSGPDRPDVTLEDCVVSYCDSAVQGSTNFEATTEWVSNCKFNYVADVLTGSSQDHTFGNNTVVGGGNNLNPTKDPLH
jgi:hypothetical protein